MELGLDRFQVHLDKLARLSKGVRAALFGGVVVLVFGAYGYFFYLPASQELAKAEQEQLQLQRKLSEVRAVAANEQAVRDAALAERLRAAGHPVRGPALFVCRHHTFGVGAIPVAAVLAGDHLVTETARDPKGGEVLVGTISSCHGALNLITVGAVAG